MLVTDPVDEPLKSTNVIVLPGGGYALHAEHESALSWLESVGLSAAVPAYPLHTRHLGPLISVRDEIRRRRAAGASRVGLIGFSAGGHLARLAALACQPDPEARADFALPRS